MADQFSNASPLSRMGPNCKGLNNSQYIRFSFARLMMMMMIMMIMMMMMVVVMMMIMMMIVVAILRAILQHS